GLRAELIGPVCIVDYVVGERERNSIVREGGTDRLLLRIYLSYRHSQLRACLEHANARRSQRQILAVCDVDQLYQYWIVEYLPPVGILLSRSLNCGIRCLLPFAGDRC